MLADDQDIIMPSNFAWGAATSAYQIEGGWDADGRGPSIWDTFCHKKGKVFQDQSGDVACDSYHLWEEDLKCIQQLGLTHYRLSLSWSRLLPDGTTRRINQKGVSYYNRVINDLLANGVSPMVTLHHFDLPQALQAQGGWQSPQIADLFDSYAQFCFQTFGDRVKLWLTINEPYIYAKFGHEDGCHAPGLDQPGVSLYLAGHNMLRAHARAWHSYDALYRPTQGGQVSLALFSDWAEAHDPSSALDVAAAERYMAFVLGWFAWPIFVNGDYPPEMKARVEAASRAQGLPSSRLPTFSKEEPRILGTADFFALNYYTSRRVWPGSGPAKIGFEGDLEVERDIDPAWPVCGNSWLAVFPEGLRKLLKYIKDKFGNPTVYITENGFSQVGPVEIEDARRCRFFRDTLLQVSKAIHEEGADVRGYFAWSLLDNFEWADGYRVRFGLYHVDFAHPRLKRTPYRSGREYAQLIAQNKTSARS
ncbi:cytosolic beta-glucosidase isoform X1 [Paramormyrops kingsleyae]|uniref:cytosolic beta-glucosidase isoform X1 n=2 Tax=Paramormyrops kingsleyae TaxID=1676925 RepID=UPI003B96CC2D